MHLQSLLWFAGAVVAAAVFYRRLLLPVWVAGLAALLFAIDDAHGMPAVWLANRNASIGVFFGLVALIAHDGWRRDGWIFLRLAGMSLAMGAILWSFRNGGSPGAAVIVPAAAALLMGSTFFYFLSRRRTPIGDIRVKVGDNLSLTLLSDPKLAVIRQYGVEHHNALGFATGKLAPFGIPLALTPSYKTMAVPTTLLVDESGVIRWIDRADDYRLRSSQDRVLEEVRRAFG